jgi:hypothetical protein
MEALTAGVSAHCREKREKKKRQQETMNQTKEKKKKKRKRKRKRKKSLLQDDMSRKRLPLTQISWSTSLLRQLAASSEEGRGGTLLR